MKKIIGSILFLLVFFVTSAYSNPPRSVTLYNYNHGKNNSQAIVFSLPGGITKTVSPGQDVDLTNDELKHLNDSTPQPISFTITTKDGKTYSQASSDSVLFKGHVFIDATMFATGMGPNDYQYSYSWRWTP